MKLRPQSGPPGPTGCTGNDGNDGMKGYFIYIYINIHVLEGLLSTCWEFRTQFEIRFLENRIFGI